MSRHLEKSIIREMKTFAKKTRVPQKSVGELVFNVFRMLRDQASLDHGHYTKGFDAVDRYIMPGVVAANSLMYDAPTKNRRTSRRRTSRR